MKTVNFLISLSLLAACGETPQKATTDADTTQPQTNTPVAAAPIKCYQYTSAADTVMLQLTQTGETVVGALTYQLKEKDRNHGDIRGTLKGDVLIADYTFQSEGVQSTRQVAFKKEGDAFIEGYGDVVEEKGVTKFKDVNALKYTSTMKLQEAPCK